MKYNKNYLLFLSVTHGGVPRVTVFYNEVLGAENQLIKETSPITSLIQSFVSSATFKSIDFLQQKQYLQSYLETLFTGKIVSIGKRAKYEVVFESGKGWGVRFFAASTEDITHQPAIVAESLAVNTSEEFAAKSLIIQTPDLGDNDIGKFYERRKNYAAFLNRALPNANSDEIDMLPILNYALCIDDEVKNFFQEIKDDAYQPCNSFRLSSKYDFGSPEALEEKTHLDNAFITYIYETESAVFCKGYVEGDITQIVYARIQKQYWNAMPMPKLDHVLVSALPALNQYVKQADLPVIDIENASPVEVIAQYLSIQNAAHGRQFFEGISLSDYFDQSKDIEYVNELKDFIIHPQDIPDGIMSSVRQKVRDMVQKQKEIVSALSKKNRIEANELPKAWCSIIGKKLEASVFTLSDAPKLSLSIELTDTAVDTFNNFVKGIEYAASLCSLGLACIDYFESKVNEIKNAYKKGGCLMDIKDCITGAKLPTIEDFISGKEYSEQDLNRALAPVTAKGIELEAQAVCIKNIKSFGVQDVRMEVFEQYQDAFKRAEWVKEESALFKAMKKHLQQSVQRLQEKKIIIMKERVKSELLDKITDRLFEIGMDITSPNIPHSEDDKKILEVIAKEACVNRQHITPVALSQEVAEMQFDKLQSYYQKKLEIFIPKTIPGFVFTGDQSAYQNLLNLKSQIESPGIKSLFMSRLWCFIISSISHAVIEGSEYKAIGLMLMHEKMLDGNLERTIKDITSIDLSRDASKHFDIFDIQFIFNPRNAFEVLHTFQAKVQYDLRTTDIAMRDPYIFRIASSFALHEPFLAAMCYYLDNDVDFFTDRKLKTKIEKELLKSKKQPFNLDIYNHEGTELLSANQTQMFKTLKAQNLGKNIWGVLAAEKILNMNRYELGVVLNEVVNRKDELAVDLSGEKRLLFNLLKLSGQLSNLDHLILPTKDIAKFLDGRDGFLADSNLDDDVKLKVKFFKCVIGVLMYGAKYVLRFDFNGNDKWEWMPEAFHSYGKFSDGSDLYNNELGAYGHVPLYFTPSPFGVLADPKDKTVSNKQEVLEYILEIADEIPKALLGENYQLDPLIQLIQKSASLLSLYKLVIKKDINMDNSDSLYTSGEITDGTLGDDLTQLKNKLSTLDPDQRKLEIMNILMMLTLRILSQGYLNRFSTPAYKGELFKDLMPLMLNLSYEAKSNWLGNVYGNIIGHFEGLRRDKERTVDLHKKRFACFYNQKNGISDKALGHYTDEKDAQAIKNHLLTFESCMQESRLDKVFLKGLDINKDKIEKLASGLSSIGESIELRTRRILDDILGRHMSYLTMNEALLKVGANGTYNHLNGQYIKQAISKEEYWEEESLLKVEQEVKAQMKKEARELLLKQLKNKVFELEIRIKDTIKDLRDEVEQAADKDISEISQNDKLPNEVIAKYNQLQKLLAYYNIHFCKIVNHFKFGTPSTGNTDMKQYLAWVEQASDILGDIYGVDEKIYMSISMADISDVKNLHRMKYKRLEVMQLYHKRFEEYKQICAKKSNKHLDKLSAKIDKTIIRNASPSLLLDSYAMYQIAHNLSLVDSLVSWDQLSDTNNADNTFGQLKCKIDNQAESTYVGVIVKAMQEGQFSGSGKEELIALDLELAQAVRHYRENHKQFPEYFPINAVNDLQLKPNRESKPIFHDNGTFLPIVANIELFTKACTGRNIPPLIAKYLEEIQEIIKGGKDQKLLSQWIENVDNVGNNTRDYLLNIINLEFTGGYYVQHLRGSKMQEKAVGTLLQEMRHAKNQDSLKHHESILKPIKFQDAQNVLIEVYPMHIIHAVQKTLESNVYSFKDDANAFRNSLCRYFIQHGAHCGLPKSCSTPFYQIKRFYQKHFKIQSFNEKLLEEQSNLKMDFNSLDPKQVLDILMQARYKGAENLNATMIEAMQSSQQYDLKVNPSGGSFALELHIPESTVVSLSIDFNNQAIKEYLFNKCASFNELKDLLQSTELSEIEDYITRCIAHNWYPNGFENQLIEYSRPTPSSAMSSESKNSKQSLVAKQIDELRKSFNIQDVADEKKILPIQKFLFEGNYLRPLPLISDLPEKCRKIFFEGSSKQGDQQMIKSIDEEFTQAVTPSGDASCFKVNSKEIYIIFSPGKMILEYRKGCVIYSIFVAMQDGFSIESKLRFDTDQMDVLIPMKRIPKEAVMGFKNLMQYFKPSSDTVNIWLELPDGTKIPTLLHKDMLKNLKQFLHQGKECAVHYTTLFQLPIFKHTQLNIYGCYAPMTNKCVAGNIKSGNFSIQNVVHDKVNYIIKQIAAEGYGYIEFYKESKFMGYVLFKPQAPEKQIKICASASINIDDLITIILSLEDACIRSMCGIVQLGKVILPIRDIVAKSQKEKNLKIDLSPMGMTIDLTVESALQSSLSETNDFTDGSLFIVSLKPEDNRKIELDGMGASISLDYSISCDPDPKHATAYVVETSENNISLGLRTAKGGFAGSNYYGILNGKFPGSGENPMFVPVIVPKDSKSTEIEKVKVSSPNGSVGYELKPDYRLKTSSFFMHLHWNESGDKVAIQTNYELRDLPAIFKMRIPRVRKMKINDKMQILFLEKIPEWVCKKLLEFSRSYQKRYSNVQFRFEIDFYHQTLINLEMLEDWNKALENATVADKFTGNMRAGVTLISAYAEIPIVKGTRSTPTPYTQKQAKQHAIYFFIFFITMICFMLFMGARITPLNMLRADDYKTAVKALKLKEYSALGFNDYRSTNSRVRRKRLRSAK